MGDDVPDLGMFDNAGFAIAVSDAHPLVRRRANWVTQMKGGFGAVREVCDTLLYVSGQLDNFSGASI
jgi:3-deoxy-D-manno-octulosonate 8-phosphate phosphatase (KDO 8-P phosphatase)